MCWFQSLCLSPPSWDITSLFQAGSREKSQAMKGDACRMDLFFLSFKTKNANAFPSLHPTHRCFQNWELLLARTQSHRPSRPITNQWQWITTVTSSSQPVVTPIRGLGWGPRLPLTVTWTGWGSSSRNRGVRSTVEFKKKYKGVCHVYRHF